MVDPSTSDNVDVDGASATGYNGVNPLELDLIVERVLEFTDHRNKLNCRRVNRRWNRKALELMREKNVVLLLHSGNIYEYLHVVTMTGQSSPSLKLSIQFGRIGDDMDAYQGLVIGVNQVLQHFTEGQGQDPNSIRFVEALSCSSFYQMEINWQYMAMLFQRVSLGLRRLHLKEGVFNQAISYLNLDIGFPELRTLTYVAILKNSVLLAQIVNRAPKLDVLEVHLEPLERHNPSSYGYRNQNLTDAFNAIAIGSFDNLTQLGTVLDSRDTYSALARLRFPRLEHLRLTLNINPTHEASKILARFLAQNCPNLKSLDFNLVQSVNRVVVFPHDELISEFPIRLPYLPKLIQFAYGVSRMSAPTNGPAMIRMDNVTPQLFPHLRYVTVKFGAFLYASDQFLDFTPTQNPPVQWYGIPALINSATFPNVRNLHLILEDLDGLFSDGTLLGYPTVTSQDACNQLHMLYPNVKSLRMDIQLRPTQETVLKLNVVTRYILEEIVGLEELEIWSNCISFLPRVLTPEIAARHQTLKELTIPRLGREFRETVNRKGTGCPASRQQPLAVLAQPPNLGLATILEFFPKLKKITVPHECVQHENLAELQRRYRKLTIVVI